ncbi:hypothetical protein ACFL1R_08010 [Candidatus Latescibacterota bacterium]
MTFIRVALQYSAQSLSGGPSFHPDLPRNALDCYVGLSSSI